MGVKKTVTANEMQHFLAEHVREYMAREHISAADLVRRCDEIEKGGVSRQTLYNIKDESAAVQLRHLVIIGRLIGRDPRELLYPLERK
jgi:hypothetical protein